LSARALLRTKQLVKFGLRHTTNLFVRGNMAWSGKNPVERWFEDLARRGTQVLLVYGDNDPGLDELERYMGPQGRRATALPGVTKELIENTDHTFTPSEARQRLREVLHAFVMEHPALPARAAE
jgi:hypothetical protein